MSCSPRRTSSLHILGIVSLALSSTHAGPNPITVIVAELLQRLEERPFAPFVIVLSNGSRHEVPSREHCTVTRFSRRITVDHDDGSFVAVNPSHIAHIELLHKPAA